jgi:class 3 adenylate cyclase
VRSLGWQRCQHGLIWKTCTPLQVLLTATVKDIIDRHHGYVARYLNDGVLAYFGYPGADEDDAEHAVHAGLTLVGSEAETQCRRR